MYSDGTVRTMRWSGSLEQMCAGRVLEPGGGGGGGSERGYPVLAADLGAAGDLLLSAGLDGAARLHDVQVYHPHNFLSQRGFHEAMSLYR